jgi:hypothetical protein
MAFLLGHFYMHGILSPRLSRLGGMRSRQVSYSMDTRKGRTGPSRMISDRGLFEGREEECLCVPWNLERHVPLQADPLFVLIAANTPRLVQREPGAVQREFVCVSCKKPIDGGREFL